MYNNKRIYLIGIGGVSMSGVAHMVKDLGAVVTGSNNEVNEYINILKNNGISVFIEHNKDNIKNFNPDIVIYTPAIDKENEELKYAIDNNIPCYERAEFLGMLSKEYKNCLCISGTHGKSTTTGLLSLVFLEANLNPTIQVGAILPEINSNIKIGSKDYLIMESCEFANSYHHFFPTASIITNIDSDHLDYFKTLDNIKTSFKTYANKIPQDGYLIVNNDDDNSNILKDTNTKVVTYGIKNKSDFTAKNIEFKENGCANYDIYYKEKFLINIDLYIPGIHNVYNSLAVFALSSKYIDDEYTIKKGIEKYKGVGRRFEFIGKYNDALIYDDYAHHPTEIETTINSLNNVKYNKNWAIFQSHTYSRTFEHLEDFAKVLSKFDNIIIAPIYAAREINTYGVSEDQLVNLIKKDNNNVIYIDSFDKIVNYLKENVKENDIVITVGAGPIDKVAKALKKEN